jgi:hypothetical protein
VSTSRTWPARDVAGGAGKGVTILPRFKSDQLGACDGRGALLRLFVAAAVPTADANEVGLGSPDRTRERCSREPWGEKGARRRQGCIP